MRKITSWFVVVFLWLYFVPSAFSGERAYVANFYSNTVSVIDTSTNTVVSTVSVGSEPWGVSVSPDGSRVYVTNASSNSVSVIDTSANTVVSTVSVGRVPYGVSVNPAGTRVYVANAGSNSVSVIDTSTNTIVSTISVGSYPVGVSVNPAGTRVYVTHYYNNSVSVIDTSTNAVVSTVSVGDGPVGVSVNPAGTRVYVANGQGNNDVSVIDTSTNTVVSTVSVGRNPYGLSVNPSGTRVYVANAGSDNSVSVIDTSTNAVVSTVAVGGRPSGVSVNPAGTRMYVTNQVSNTVSVIDTSTNTVMSTVSVGNGPMSIGNFIGTVPTNTTTKTTATTLASSLNPSTSGALVTFTATVSGAGGTPTGTVTFQEKLVPVGQRTLGTGTLSGGQATYSTESLSSGIHYIAAVYSGDSAFAASTSSDLTQTVNTGGGGSTVVKSSMTSPADGSTLTSTSQTFSWRNTGASEYHILIGSTQGGADIYNKNQGTNTSATISGLPSDGRKIYLRLWTNVSGTWESNDYSYISYKATTATGTTTTTIVKAAISSPANGSTLSSGSTTFFWNNTGASEYHILIGSTQGGADIYNKSQGTSTSVTISGLPTDGKTLYLRLWTKIDSFTWENNDYTYTSYKATTATGTTTTKTTITKAAISSPADGSTLSSTSPTFTWNNTGASEYHILIGTIQGGADIYNKSQGTSTSVTISGLPTDGKTLYLRLWTKIDSFTWENNDYTYTSYRSATSTTSTTGTSSTTTAVKAVMQSPADGTTLTSSSPTFTWNNTGALKYGIVISNQDGRNIYAQEFTNTSATIPNLSSDGRTLYVRLWTLFSGTWDNGKTDYNDYTYTSYKPATSTTSTTGTSSTTTAVKAVMQSPADGTTLTSASPTFTWNNTGALKYGIVITNQDGKNIYAQDFANTSATIPNLSSDGRTLYVRLWTLFSGTWDNGKTDYNDYTYTSYKPAASTTSTTSVKAVMQSPADGATLTSASPTFAWNNTGALKYGIVITNQDGKNIYAQDFTNTSATIPNLSSDGRTLYVRLWTLFSGTWDNGKTDYNDYTYTSYKPATTNTTTTTTSTSNSARFLSFPLNCGDGACASFNYSDGAYTLIAEGFINSVLDHSMESAYDFDGRVLTFTEESRSGGKTDGGCYPDTSAEKISVNGLYRGTDDCSRKSGLNYEGHPGYDFYAEGGMRVYSSAAGTVVNYGGQRCIPKGLKERFQAGKVSTCDDWGSIGVDHGNGYVTQYMHLSRIDKKIGDSVKAGEQIGVSGHKAPVSLSDHLHFEVLKAGTCNLGYCVVDPYGWEGSGKDPLEKVTGVPNVRLWKDNSRHVLP